MSDAHAEHGHADPGHGHDAGGHGHEAMGFFRKYVFSTNHKIIGKQFLFTSLIFLLVAGSLAMGIRWQLAYPEKPMPILGSIIGLSKMDRKAIADIQEKADKEGRALNDAEKQDVESRYAINDDEFIMFTTMHGTLMIFFVIIPILVGAFGNFLIPLHVGTHDMAFPKLNALSYWCFWLACVLILIGFFVPGGHSQAGWTGYSPLSAHHAPAATPGSSQDPDWFHLGGQDFWLLSMFFVGMSSILGAVNYLTTILKMRAPGLSMMRLPLTTWGQFITAILQLLATPVLGAALMMLMMERFFDANFFTPSGLEVSKQAMSARGGHPLMWQHIFWFYSHPAVYILVLPAMGFTSDLLAVGCRKPVFGYKAMVFSMSGIAGLGFIVWAHHMFVSGMNPTLGMAFMVATLVIALPSAIKVFNWLGTVWRGSIRFDVPTLNALTFVALFTIGGLDGIFMAASPVDIFIHDTYFIVSHFHYVVFGGSLFAVFGAIYYWYPKMWGRMMSATAGKIHWLLSFVFFNLTFFPMHIIGAGGHMRRIPGIQYYPFLNEFHWWNQFISISAFCLGATQLIFIGNFVLSIWYGRKAESNPWQASTLEWSIPSPAPEHNYHTIPTVNTGAYEYGKDGKEGMDYEPQTEQKA